MMLNVFEHNPFYNSWIDASYQLYLVVFYRSLTLEGCGACLYKIHDNLYLSTSIRKQLNWYMIWDSCLTQPNKGLSEHKFICDNNAWIYMLCIQI